MKRLTVLLTFVLFLGIANAQEAEKTDSEIKQELIRRSIASYPGNCPCPYNTDRAGRRCGRRSAYSRPGGRSPLCYEGDVTQKMVDDYRRQQKEREKQDSRSKALLAPTQREGPVHPASYSGLKMTSLTPGHPEQPFQSLFLREQELQNIQVIELARFQDSCQH